MRLLHECHIIRFATRGLVLTAVATVGAIFACTASSPAADTSDPNFHFLAADASLRAQMTNVNVTMCQATYVGEVLQQDQPWESSYEVGYVGSVVTDPSTGLLRMYYEMEVPGRSMDAAWPWQPVPTESTGPSPP